jgi:hypothetical protein
MVVLRPVLEQLLVAYVLMSAYMRLCYVLTTISKTYLLLLHGPCESLTLPGQHQINTISGLMFMVASEPRLAK